MLKWTDYTFCKNELCQFVRKKKTIFLGISMEFQKPNFSWKTSTDNLGKLYWTHLANDLVHAISESMFVVILKKLATSRYVLYRVEVHISQILPRAEIVAHVMGLVLDLATIVI